MIIMAVMAVIVIVIVIAAWDCTGDRCNGPAWRLLNVEKHFVVRALSPMLCKEGVVDILLSGEACEPPREPPTL